MLKLKQIISVDKLSASAITKEQQPNRAGIGQATFLVSRSVHPNTHCQPTGASPVQEPSMLTCNNRTCQCYNHQIGTDECDYPCSSTRHSNTVPIGSGRQHADSRYHQSSSTASIVAVVNRQISRIEHRHTCVVWTSVRSNPIEPRRAIQVGNQQTQH